jgi:5-methylcytosine-specific restriction protein A
LQKEKCPLCNRIVRDDDMTLHHYIPKSEGGTLNDTMRLCLTCHSFLHNCIPLEEVHMYDTYDKLEENECYKKYLGWVRTITHPNMIAIKKIKRTIKLID